MERDAALEIGTFIRSDCDLAVTARLR